MASLISRAHMAADGAWQDRRERAEKAPLEMTDETESQAGVKMRTISLFGREFVMPQSRRARIIIGCVLVFLGCFGFLPVLGFWMIPLGLLILSYEFSRVRRWRRRSSVWWGVRRGRRRVQQPENVVAKTTRER